MKNFFSSVWAVVSKPDIIIGILISIILVVWLVLFFDWKDSVPSIASAFIAAALIGIIERAISILKVQPRLRKFREFFGYRPGDGRDIFIVVPFFRTETGPTFDKSKTEYLEPEDDAKPAKWLEEHKHIETGLKTLAAFEDLRSAASLSSLFAEEDSIAPKIVSDNDWEEERRVGSRTYTSIAIGLFSNKVSRKFYHATFADHVDSFLSINPLEGSTSGGQIRIRKGTEDVRNWPQYNDRMLAAPAEGSPVHAVILKVVDKSSDCIGFVVGGLSEHGTSAAGRYLKESWEDIYELVAQDKEKILCRSFALVLNIHLIRKGGIDSIDVVVSDVYACESDRSFSLLAEKLPHDGS